MELHEGEPLFKSFLQGGFECSTHRRCDGVRLDLVTATGHDRWAFRDYQRLSEQGLKTVRDGLRWHAIERTPGHFDFAEVVRQIRSAQRVGVQVVWDLCHYGWPDGLDIFSASFVDRFARFARRFIELLRSEGDEISLIAPINEISFFAWAGGHVAYFNPCQRNRGAELKAQLVRAAIAATEAIWEVDRRVRILQIDPLINVAAADPAVRRQRRSAEAYRLAQFEAWDMLAGRIRPELGGAERYLDILGVNFYSTNQWRIPGGRKIRVGHPQYIPFREMLTEFYDRYRRSLFVAETGIEDQARPAWLRYVGREVRAAMRRGVPVQGICLYPIVNHPGWADDRHCHNGLWDYPLPDGGREIYQPLAEEIARQRIMFGKLVRNAT